MTKLRWYFDRLRSMTFHEIAFRAFHWIIAQSYRRLAVFRTTQGQFNRNADTYFRKYIQGYDSHYYFENTQRSEMIESFKRGSIIDFNNLFRRADRVLENRVYLFGKEYYLGEEINWNADPVFGNEWPQRRSLPARINDRKPRMDIRVAWELNRHHHFVLLGKAYFLSRNHKYASVLIDRALDWVHKCRPWGGIQWSSSLEAGIRIINWIWAFEFIRDFEGFTETMFREIYFSISQQADFVYHNLSMFSSANNHLVGEAASLAIAGMRFPWLPQARKWRQRGFSILEREMMRQFLSDGVPAEQSLHYLAFDLDLLLLVWRLAELNNYEVPAKWYELLEITSDFLSHLMDDGCHPPSIGDSDDGTALGIVDSLEFNNYRSILTSIATILGKTELKSVTRDWDEKNEWLLGAWGREQFQSLQERETELSSKIYPRGGYFVSRDQTAILTFDFGDLGYLSTAAHGHADALGLTLRVNGGWVLIDPGTFSYSEDSRWRNYFRSTCAHNTVAVNNLDQSEIRGPFLWGRKARTKLLDYEVSPSYDFISAEHDGYSHLGVVHRRNLIHKKGRFVLISDEIQGRGIYPVEQLWHFPQNAVLKQSGEDFEVIVKGGKILIKCPLIAALNAKTYSGSEEPVQGWSSEHYGSKAPAPVLSFRGDLNLPVELNTIFIISEDKNIPSVEIEEAYSILFRKRSDD